MAGQRSSETRVPEFSSTEFSTIPKDRLSRLRTSGLASNTALATLSARTKPPTHNRLKRRYSPSVARQTARPPLA